MNENPSILSHVSLGTNHFAQAVAFYDKVLATLNIRRDLAPVSNTWPLEISVSGYAGRKVSGREANGAFRLAPVKEYRQEKFLFPYDAAKHDYQTPGDYPLRMDW